MNKKQVAQIWIGTETIAFIRTSKVGSGLYGSLGYKATPRNIARAVKLAQRKNMAVSSWVNSINGHTVLKFTY